VARGDQVDLDSLGRGAVATLGKLRTRALNTLRHLGDVPVEDLAITPRQAVWSRDQVVLYRYEGGSRSRRTPVLLVMSLVTRPYVFDLRPGNSLVEDLLKAGFDVFLLDWGSPTPADAPNTLSTYCDEYIPRAVDAVCAISDVEAVTVFGYCLGGTLALLSTAGNPEMLVRNLVVLATPLDFAELRPLPTMLGAGRLEPQNVIDDSGNVPASFVRDLFTMTQPTAKMTTLASKWESTTSDESTAAHRALIGWSEDHIPFPGAAFREVVELLLRRRALVGGRLPLGNRTVDLSLITIPVLSVVGDRDTLVPAAATTPLESLLGDDVLETIHLPAGHAGLFVGRQARKQCVPSIVSWLTARD
jgi:polyhydroxyalkanoate synthase subunit PhaC